MTSVSNGAGEDSDLYPKISDTAGQTSHAELMYRLERLEEKTKSRSLQRHEENTKLHQIISELDNRIDKQEAEVAILAKNGADQLALLNKIHDAIAGSLGAAGILERVKVVETDMRTLEKRMFIASGGLVILGFVATIINWKDIIK